MKINKRKGILFWVTGLSGSGKTSVAKNIKKKIERKYGPTIVVSGDDLRKIFNFKSYSLKERILLSKKFNKFCKYITNQKINLIFAVIGMFDRMRLWNRKNIENYLEIYIKADIKKIIKLKKKKIYLKKGKVGPIMGINIKPEFPKNPHIKIQNNFNQSISKISDNIFKQILKKLN